MLGSIPSFARQSAELKRMLNFILIAAICDYYQSKLDVKVFIIEGKLPLHSS